MRRKTFYLLALLALMTTPAFAQQTFAQNAPLTLRSSVSDGDGQVTLGDLFDNAGSASRVVVGTRSGATAILDAAAVQSIAARNGVYWDNPRGLRRIIVSGGADSEPQADVATVQTVGGSNRDGLNREVLVFTHAMNTGDIVQPEDLQYAQVAVTSGSLPSDPSTVIGKTVRFPLRQGGVVHSGDLTSPTVVHRGETLTVTWTSGSLSLSMNGLVQKDAAVGDLIQVQNPASKKLVDVVVTGPGQGIAGQAANRFRSNTQVSMR